MDAVLEAWPAEGDFYRSSDEVQSALLKLEQALNGSASPTTAHSTSDKLLERRLLEALRIEVLRCSACEERTEPVEAYLEVLRCLEEQRRATLPEDARDFATRLADPDGFELLVEVAHDLRSPLTSVSFLSETLRSGYSGEVTEMQRSQLGLIYSASLGMISVVSDVMELARRGGGLFDGGVAPFSIAAVFNTLDQMLQPMAEAKGVALRWVLPSHDRVEGYSQALTRVIMNLATNALKFIDKGHVEISAENVGPRTIAFSVLDTGRGIAPEDQQSLYQTFRQYRGGRRYYFSGSGLGLSIARRLLRQMGSDLELETRIGWGTRFSFTIDLPAVREL
jgi:signal transduction histidine kinase